jgi:phosphoglycerol transferase MdoB-like AlkP superfamily enzyme
MKNIRYLFTIAVLFVAVFELLRGLLLWRYLDMAEGIPTATLLRSFLVGARFDLTVTGYILAPVALFGLPPFIGLSDSRLTRKIALIYLTVTGGLAFFLNIVDLEFFRHFNTRLDHVALQWFDTPGMVAQMLWESFSVPLYLIGLAVLAAGWYFILRTITRRVFAEEERTKRTTQLLLYPLMLSLVFLAIRGRVSYWSPINWGVAYFSPYHFANQLALNSAFTFVRDTFIENRERAIDREISEAMPLKKALSRTEEMLGIRQDDIIPGSLIARKEGNAPKRRLNVIFVIGESMAANFLGCLDGAYDLGPEFDRMAEDGLLFTRFFANAGFTNNAIFSALTGLPPLPGKPLMKRTEAQREFSGLASVLRRRGYHTRFYVPHDPHFDNTQGFVIANGFETLVSKEDYPADSVISSLGVPDGVMFQRVLSDLDQTDEPFLAVILTGSNHYPYICPDRPYPRFPEDDPNAEKFNAFSYADWALGRFYDGIRESDWGDSTLVVITGDTGLNWHPKLELDFSLYHIPLLMICPGVIEPGRNARVGSQKDIVATVMDILGGEWINNTLGESLLKEGDEHALFHHAGAIGFIRGDFYALRTRDGKTQLLALPDLSPVAGQGNVADRMLSDFHAFLAVTYRLIATRQYGLPDYPLDENSTTASATTSDAASP